MILKNIVTGKRFFVTATINHPASSYNKPVWVDAQSIAHAQVGMELMAGYALIDERVELGKLLKSIREDKGLSKYYFAKMGIRQESLNTIESGSLNYTIDKLFLYLGILGVDIEDVEIPR